MAPELDVFSIVREEKSKQSLSHPLPEGYLLNSPGAHFLYRIIGPCCRLFDRDQLPWPSCRIEWHSKEPSWRRIGKRFVPDTAARTHPSYWVEILGPGYTGQPFVLTLYPERLSPSLQEWWYARKPTPTGAP